MTRLFKLTVVAALVLILAISWIFLKDFSRSTVSTEALQSPVTVSSNEIVENWRPPNLSSVPDDEHGALIRYGRELVAHTSAYLGPRGTVAPISNGMNCQNCHLDAGTKPFGNNYSAVASTYPKFRARSGTVETIDKRINDCLERSLNGKPLSKDSHELKAIIAYILWVGSEVPKGENPKGSGLGKLPLLDVPADPIKGAALYQSKCIVCHGKNGEGIRNTSGDEFIYPPLWGNNSFNTGAGLFRMISFASFIKNNMPFGATSHTPSLTDEEAWHIAAFVNSQARPGKVFPQDWPDISKKPVDHPFGPFADGFSVEQHKYGPFKPIIEKRKTDRQ